jgi:cell division protein ZapA (FtsZ GTPase activity inhibitor)
MENDEIQSLKEQIADLKRRWPAHSVSPAMFQELEDLEEALEAALKRVERDSSAEENSSD